MARSAACPDRKGAMNHLKELIAKAKAKLAKAQDLKDLAGHRWQVNHDNAHLHHKKQKELEHEATALKNRFAKNTEVERVEAAAKRQSHKASKAHKRALYWIDKAKLAEKQIAFINGVLDHREKKLKELESKGCHRDGDKIVGGTAKQNLQYAMHYSMIHGGQFYSQVGAFTLKLGLSGPPRGYRNDCSSWWWSMLYAAGVPDPTGENYGSNVFTGNEAEHGEHIAESQLDTGCAVYFGTAPFHHVEAKDGPMSEGPWTVGHGSDPIDRGTVTLLPGPRAFRRYIK